MTLILWASTPPPPSGHLRTPPPPSGHLRPPTPFMIYKGTPTPFWRSTNPDCVRTHCVVTCTTVRKLSTDLQQTTAFRYISPPGPDFFPVRAHLRGPSPPAQQYIQTAWIRRGCPVGTTNIKVTLSLRTPKHPRGYVRVYRTPSPTQGPPPSSRPPPVQGPPRPPRQDLAAPDSRSYTTGYKRLHSLKDEARPPQAPDTGSTPTGPNPKRQRRLYGPSQPGGRGGGAEEARRPRPRPLCLPRRRRPSKWFTCSRETVYQIMEKHPEKRHF